VEAQTSESTSPFKVTTDIVSNYEGVYLSANDFTNGKVSFENNQINKKYKFYLHEIYHTSSIKIISGDSIIKLNKDSIFGFRDKKNTCHRFYNKVEYEILNPSEKILLYRCSSFVGGSKNIRTVTNYFFSANADSPIYPLSKWNLKTVLYKEVLFHELLDVYFHCDKQLIAYDGFNKIYTLNRIYKLSKQ
jgi:hypothetical protein